MDPLTILAIGEMAWSAISSIWKAKAEKKAAQTQAEAAEMTARQAEYNAGIADAQARDAENRGLTQESRFREQVRGLIGAQRSGFAAQGVVVTNGSAADVQKDAQTLAEGDVRTIRSNAQREAWGFRVDAENYRRNAAVARKGGVIALQEGRNAERAGYINAASTVIGGTTSLLAQRYGWRQAAAPAAAGTRAYQGDALTLDNAA